MNALQTSLAFTDDITPDSVLRALSRHVGRGQGITAKRLVQEICGDYSTGRERALRHVIEQLRNEGTAIVATPSSGYYIARDADELAEAISFLRKRALCSLRQIRQLKRLAVPELAGQSRFTT